ncbi:MAG: DUF1553 domain-containing protein, partial [Planctomycetia bacterium]
TGYSRVGCWPAAPADREQFRYDWLEDIVATTGQTFLGLTVNCARCHDHKIDPIPQRDYYSLLSFFDNITPMGDRNMNLAAIERPLFATAADREAYERKVADLQHRRDEAQRAVTQIEQRFRIEWERQSDGDESAGGKKFDLAAALRADGERIPGAAGKQDYDAKVAALEALKKEVVPVDKALVVTERGPVPADTHVFFRGNPRAEKRPENRVGPACPAILKAKEPVIPTPSAGATTSGRRTALARWLVGADNPLTARVMANRIWQHHFGRGIVRSASNFGMLGDPPTHPELLDWLATELVAGGWRLKSLHKRILMSQAYRAASTGNAEASAHAEASTLDPLNDSLWRFDMRRLSAEELRDSIHVASGAFNPKMFGPGVYPAIPKAVMAGQSRPGDGWGTSSPEEQARRSIYAFVKRSLLTPILADFDLADTDSTCPVRFTTTQPTQALGMMNGEFLQQQARVFAARVRREACGPDAADVPGQVRRALEIALVRRATDAEVERGVALVARLDDVDGVGPGRAMELFCLMVLNLNEFAYLD